MLRIRLALFVVVAAALAVVPTGGASVMPGAVTAQTGWSSLGTLAPGVSVSRKVVTVAGYGGSRTLTRISWPLGDSHVTLDAGPINPSGYGPSQHSFAEGSISGFGRATGGLAGINGDTFCGGCANNGNDTLHGVLVHNRRIYATGAGQGSGPEVGYTPAGGMIMGSARAVPVRLSLPNGTATVAVWNARSISGRTVYPDQVSVFDHAGATVTVPKSFVALALAGQVTVAGAASTVGNQFRGMLELAVPYQDTADKAAGSSTRSEWVNAYRISQTGGTAVTAAMPVSGAAVSNTTITVPSDGVVLVATAGTPAAKGLLAAAGHHTVPVTLDDNGWGAASSIIDGKFQMVSRGVAHTRYPGWNDSWPWYCQGTGRGCVRAAVAETSTRGWLIVEAGSGGNGLTMPDFARVLAQLGAKNAMGFDSNSHADFWRTGSAPITAFGYEPGTPEGTLLRYH
jgi:hypothetical protein